MLQFYLLLIIFPSSLFCLHHSLSNYELNNYLLLYETLVHAKCFWSDLEMSTLTWDKISNVDLQEADDADLYVDAHVVDIERKPHDSSGVCSCVFVVRYDSDNVEV